MQKKQKHMKKAAIESVLIWIVLFVGFATLFFFIIDYATILRIKDNLNAISDYGANYVGTNGIGDDISQELNNLKAKGIDPISADTTVMCSEDSSIVPPEYQVIFITQTTNNSYKFYNNQLRTKRVVFNQRSGSTITCTLNVTLN